MTGTPNLKVGIAIRVFELYQSDSISVRIITLVPELGAIKQCEVERVVNFTVSGTLDCFSPSFIDMHQGMINGVLRKSVLNVLNPGLHLGTQLGAKLG